MALDLTTFLKELIYHHNILGGKRNTFYFHLDLSKNVVDVLFLSIIFININITYLNFKTALM